MFSDHGLILSTTLFASFFLDSTIARLPFHHHVENINSTQVVYKNGNNFRDFVVAAGWLTTKRYRAQYRLELPLDLCSCGDNTCVDTDLDWWYILSL